MKKVISLFLSIMMLLSITAGLDVSAYALASSGSCGNNVRWSFDSSTGTLTISGTGKMYDYTTPDDANCNLSPFYKCKTEINKIIINSGVTSIGKCAFYLCSGLTSIAIPNSVTSIGSRAFYYCGLTSVTTPESITSIGAYAFCNCEHLTNITISNSVTAIGSYAFEWCRSLTSIKIPDSVTSIGQGAFIFCYQLKSITIPNSVTFIDNSTFSNCSNLTNVTIPKSITSIGQGAFNSCKSLKQIYYNGSETLWKKISINSSNNDYLYNALITYSECVTGDKHIYNYYSGTITTQPTCTEAGVKTIKCINCSSGDIVTVPALGHNYTEWVTKAATCTESGIKTYTCSRCNNSYTATVKALGHNYKTTVKKATPKESGYSDSVCTRCGDEHYKCIESPEVSITQYVYDYDGKTKKPEVLVYKNGEYNSYLSKENYSIVYPKESKKLGTYTVKIVLKGAYYSGTFEESFKIQPKSVNPKKIKTKPYSKEQISVSWKKVKGVDGYIVYRWSNKKGKYVKYKKTKKTSIKIKRENKKTNQVDFVIATYKKQGKKNYEGYWIGKTEWVKLSAPTFKIEQNEIKEFTMVFPYKDFYYIQWSNNSDFSVDDKNTSKNYWVKTGMYADKNNDPAKKVSRIRVFGLKANQTVYVRARKVYYNKKGKLVLGPWSKAKKVITY